MATEREKAARAAAEEIVNDLLGWSDAAVPENQIKQSIGLIASCIAQHFPAPAEAGWVRVKDPAKAREALREAFTEGELYTEWPELAELYDALDHPPEAPPMTDRSARERALEVAADWLGKVGVIDPTGYRAGAGPAVALVESMAELILAERRAALKEAAERVEGERPDIHAEEDGEYDTGIRDAAQIVRALAHEAGE